MKTVVAFNTAQDIEFLKWLKTTDYEADMIHLDAGYDPDYETGVYYAWFTWELEEAALEEYIHCSAEDEQTEHTVWPLCCYWDERDPNSV